MNSSLQWGGRFNAPPDSALLQYGSSLEEDLVLAPFDVRCSLAHVAALREGGIISAAQADGLQTALEKIVTEIEDGSFRAFAQASGAEDIHGAIDARVREIAKDAGESLHAGRSRNDQVATTLLLYCAQRTRQAQALTVRIAETLVEQARLQLAHGTLLAATTHWQPAQPVLLAFWLCAAAEPFARAARRFQRAAEDAMEWCPLGSAAVAGSSLALDRKSAAKLLGFDAPSRNAMDAIGNRDVALDAAHAFVRAVLDASRICEELILWCTPAFGYARLGDAASTGSSLMPQKRNPDPFELVRGTSAALTGQYAGALASTSGVALSYHRDLQVTKGAVLSIVERALAALDAFARALPHVQFNKSRMNETAGQQYTVATDVADALIARGMTARAAHEAVGRKIRESEEDGKAPDWPDARASVNGKATEGSTNPKAVEAAIRSISLDLAELAV